MIVLRSVIGDELRRRRLRQGRTLRDVSAAARVSLGYLSEVERGQKEASSELLASIAVALDIPMSALLASVTHRVAGLEGLRAVDGGRVAGGPDSMAADVAQTHDRHARNADRDVAAHELRAEDVLLDALDNVAALAVSDGGAVVAAA
ncbi:MAG: helix-turn-helix domain-containing protein [Actinomycetota bacterium]|nr:MAG: helix-turn-helix domain-containing protein [Actinomycetota bacterium]